MKVLFWMWVVSAYIGMAILTLFLGKKFGAGGIDASGDAVMALFWPVVWALILVIGPFRLLMALFERISLKMDEAQKEPEPQEESVSQPDPESAKHAYNAGKRLRQALFRDGAEALYVSPYMLQRLSTYDGFQIRFGDGNRDSHWFCGVEVFENAGLDKWEFIINGKNYVYMGLAERPAELERKILE